MSDDGIVGEYRALLAETDADILAMQVGDFYEFFEEASAIVERELDLKVSEKASDGDTYPMAGVPVDQITPYLKQLVERGYRVAVADQRNSEDTTREISRVVTPGTLLETTDTEARYLAAIVREDSEFGLAFADVTTGRFHATTVTESDDVFTECYRFDPVEILPGPDLRSDKAAMTRIREELAGTISQTERNDFAPGAAQHAVREQFGREVTETLDLDIPAIQAAGAILAYVSDSGVGVLESMTRIQPYRTGDHVRLDATTQRNLELLEPMGSGGQSLLATINRTRTAAGSRLLREWLTRPRGDEELLSRRLDSVGALAQAALARETIRDTLADTRDLQRLAGRAVHGSADAGDLLQIRETLTTAPTLCDRVSSDPTLEGSPLSTVTDRLDQQALHDLQETLEAALRTDVPSDASEGRILRPSYDSELKAVVEQHESAQNWMDELADREKAKTGITHLQVDRNMTDGFYIQVGRSETDGVPPDYEEIKTLKNSKRYTTSELRERERELLRLEERRSELERELFEEIRKSVATRAAALREAGRAIAELDVLASMASHATENGWVRPDLSRDGIHISNGRHPVVEQTTEFVPNDATLTNDRKFLIVTGPNMSGKSTYLRQVALIVLLAQIGSFVPADAAHIEPVDGIFTRVGALDELAQGRSTFMVEMQELSNILHAATEDSLVILDEVGRGTATYDGISIAWAATEYLHNEVGAGTLFATHYHELTSLADHLPRVENVHVAAEERGDEVTFLRTVRDGPTDRSYGIHVAELAGVPTPVVDRARTVLSRLREEKAIEARGGTPADEPTQVVFDLGSGELQSHRVEPEKPRTSIHESAQAEPSQSEKVVLSELAAIDPAEITPATLLAKIERWQERLE